MKTLKRIVFIGAFAVIAICTGLLITNYDPNNPTNRRYSSEPVITQSDDLNIIGESGENVLSKDLGMLRNEKSKPRQAFCNPEPQNIPSDIECIFTSNEIENFRIPDFISESYIAESKNARELSVNQERNYKQIRAFALASKETERPLYIYVRHNTEVGQAYYDLYQEFEIDGRIIHYFQTEQAFVDPVDFNLLMGIVGGLSIIVIWTGISGIVTFKPKPQSSVVVPEHKSSRRARNAVDDYDNFMRSAGDNARRTLDD